jgi:hypothetical protein
MLFEQNMELPLLTSRIGMINLSSNINQLMNLQALSPDRPIESEPQQLQTLGGGIFALVTQVRKQ